jgi:type II secretory pathway pseudopilin PulG
MRRNEGGYVSGMLIGLIVVIVLLVGAVGFGIWAFMERQDYKDNSDEKAAAAAAQAKTETQAEDAAKYAEEAKNPLKAYVGPSAFGSVSLMYPKTWSGYVVFDEQGNPPLDDYFHPDVVPDASNEKNSFALRVRVLSEPYDQVLQDFQSGVEEGTATVKPYKLPKVESVTGSRIDGKLENEKQGSMVIFPLRNVTLQVWTEAEQYKADFDNIILPNMSFSP